MFYCFFGTRKETKTKTQLRKYLCGPPASSLFPKPASEFSDSVHHYSLFIVFIFWCTIPANVPRAFSSFSVAKKTKQKKNNATRCWIKSKYLRRLQRRRGRALKAGARGGGGNNRDRLRDTARDKTACGSGSAGTSRRPLTCTFRCLRECFPCRWWCPRDGYMWRRRGKKG